jgi:hypothetical protein
MASPSVTWTFTNGTTSDATQVNTNLQDLIDCMSDGTTDFSIGTVTVAGASTFNGTVTLGNSTADDITFTGSIAASVPVKANATYDFGGSTTGMRSYYIGNGALTVRLLAGTLTESYTITLPVADPDTAGKTLIFSATGAAEFRYHDKFTASKTADYTATGDETIIPCAPTSTMTVSLPASATMTNKTFTVIKTNADAAKTVTLDPNGSELINGVASKTLYGQYEAMTLSTDGTGWIIKQYTPPTPTTQTASSSAQIDIDVTSGGTTGRVEIEFINVKNATDNSIFQVLVSTDNGSTFKTGASDYKWAAGGNDAAGGADFDVDTDGDSEIQLTGALGADNTSSASSINGKLTVYAPASTGEYKHMYWSIQFWDNLGPNMRAWTGTGAYLATTAITHVRFKFASGNITSGTFIARPMTVNG